MDTGQLQPTNTLLLITLFMFATMLIEPYWKLRELYLIGLKVVYWFFAVTRATAIRFRYGTAGILSISPMAILLLQSGLIQMENIFGAHMGNCASSADQHSGHCWFRKAEKTQ